MSNLVNNCVDDLPHFSKFDPSTINASLTGLLDSNLSNIEALLDQNTEYNWDNLIAPIEELQTQLENYWSTVSHLNSVCNTDALRKAYSEAQPKISAYYTSLGQNHKLYSAYQQLDLSLIHI